MSRRVVHPLLALIACAGLVAAAPLPAGPEDESPQPEKGAAKADDRVKQGDRRPFRDRMRERCVRLLTEMREDQGKLEEALKRFDAGAGFDEIRASLPERLALRFRSGGDEGSEGGPRWGDRDRFGPSNNTPFNDQDWEAVNAIIKHAQPDMLEKFNELRQKDAEQAQKSMLAAYPRLRPLLELYKHDREAFDLRLEELVILRKSIPLAKDVIDLRKAGKADDSPEVLAAREKLRDLGKRHHENRLAIQKHELVVMRQRLEKREKELEEQAASPDRSVDRAIDGLIKQAERGGGRDGPDGRPDGRPELDGPGGPPGPPGPPGERRGGPDGPRRRGDSNNQGD